MNSASAKDLILQALRDQYELTKVNDWVKVDTLAKRLGISKSEYDNVLDGVYKSDRLDLEINLETRRHLKLGSRWAPRYG